MVRDVKVAGLDEDFDRLDHRRLEAEVLQLRVPRRPLFEVGGVRAPASPSRRSPACR